MVALLHPVSVTAGRFSCAMNQRCFITTQLASSLLVGLISLMAGAIHCKTQGENAWIKTIKELQ